MPCLNYNTGFYLYLMFFQLKYNILPLIFLPSSPSNIHLLLLTLKLLASFSLITIAYVYLYVCANIQIQPTESIFVAYVYVITGMTTLYWITN